METLRLNMPAEAVARVTLALHQATDSILTIHATATAVLDPGNVWTDSLPRLVTQLREAANTETDDETGRALIATMHHLEDVYADRMARHRRRTS